ncbi:hypothetical protein KSS87_019628, partial [Heliosperma pusillum]
INRVLKENLVRTLLDIKILVINFSKCQSKSVLYQTLKKLIPNLIHWFHLINKLLFLKPH